MQNEKAKRGLNQVFRYDHSLMVPKVILEATNGRLPVDLAVPEEILGLGVVLSRNEGESMTFTARVT
jgi:hypothetical protein